MNRVWKHDPENHVYYLENIVYCRKPLNEKLQCMHIFAPEAYFDNQGVLDTTACFHNNQRRCYTSETAPVICYNGIGGYSECCPEYLNDRNRHFLRAGYILVSLGARGRQSCDDNGLFIGKVPAGLVDLKAGIRFLRHFHDQFPGNMDRIITVGTSAGGAMSALLGTTGNNQIYNPYLEQIGAYMEETDAVFASQCYCPITLLEYADMAYEWMFHEKAIWIMNPKMRPKVLTPFQQMLSKNLAESFPEYVNSLNLGYELGADGRSGSFYVKMMEVLSESLEIFLNKNAETPVQKEHLIQELNAGTKLISWDGEHAVISDLDAYVRVLLGRMKTCPAFDSIDNNSRENEVFGSEIDNYRHFSVRTSNVISECRKDYDPTEHIDYGIPDIQELDCLTRMMNPLKAIVDSDTAKHFRIRAGSKDADTSFAISLILALALQNYPDVLDVDYALIWGMGHCDADYPDEVCIWIDSLL